MGCGNSKAAAVTQPHAATAPVRQNSPTVGALILRGAPYFVRFYVSEITK